MSRLYREAFKEDPVYPALNACSQVMLIADAITAAKSEDIAKTLLANKFEGWNATVSFARGDGPYWQQWTPPMLLTQYTGPDIPFSEARIVFPPEFNGTVDLLVELYGDRGKPTRAAIGCQGLSRNHSVEIIMTVLFSGTGVRPPLARDHA